jgi:DNA-binding NtrC family response regulator
MRARVLIVDDDPVQRRLLDSMVRKFGHEPLIAESGEAAVTLLTGQDTERIDCVVLDLVMPDLDGLGVLARLHEAGINVPVIVQTAHGGIDNVTSAMRAGALDFLVKPVGAERLHVSLRNALEKGALEDELARIKRSRSGTLGTAPATVPAQSPAAGMLGLLDAHGDVRPLDELEGEVIRFAIAHYRGQMSEIARRLQIGRSTLYRKLDHLGVAERHYPEQDESLRTR